jgi:outer membrane protein assembly factor BamE (lipoprotein component of BamABCDE complex)
MVSMTNSLHKAIAAAGLLLCTTGIATYANAEQIKIPIGQQTAAQSAQMPAKGMTKARVQAAFGEPLEITPAKGQPPISSWKYREFVVYFENDHVIHSVAIFKPQQDQAAPTE